MTAAAELSEARKLWNNLLRFAGCDEVAGLVRKTYDRVRVSNVNPLGVRAAWIKSDAEGKVETISEGRNGLRLAVGPDAAQDPDLVAVRVGQEDIAIRRGAHQPWLLEAL